MNERIKELAEKANLEIDPAYPDHNQKVLEKFAELIVNECASFVEPARKVGVMTKEPEKLPTYIKEYFGVK